MRRQSIPVVPGTLYFVTIGAGGVSVATDTAGSPGGDTTFSSAGGPAPTVFTWSGASGGALPASAAAGGRCFKATGGTNATGYTNAALGIQMFADGGFFSSGSPHTGNMNIAGGFAAGQVGATNTGFGGSGGGAGPEGAGAIGGAGGTAGAGSPGVAGGANTGAGGGGGGGAAAGSGGVSGAGGSGKLYLDYVSAFPNTTLPSVVQVAIVETSNGQPFAATFAANVTAGNTIVVMCLAGSNSTPVVYNVPTDGEGNPYAALGAAYSDAANQWQAACFWTTAPIIGGTTNKVTGTYSGGFTGGGNDMYCFEVAGVRGFAGLAISSAASGTTISTGNIPMLHEFGLVLAGSLQNASTDPTHPNGTGFVLQQRTPGNASCIEYATGVSTPIPATVLLQGGGGAWLLVGVGFNGTN